MSTIKDLFNIYSKEDIPLKSTKRGYIQENSDFQTLISYEEKPKESKFKELILLNK